MPPLLGALFRSLRRSRTSATPENAGPKNVALENAAPRRRLHLGCGGDVRAGWINLDSRRLPGVDIVADLDACRQQPLPLAADTIDEFLGSHILEHLGDPLAFMQELHRVARPGAMVVFRVPYGSSDDADQDPTHVRRYFQRSFYYFSQLGYTHFDYGYRGDWDTVSIVLTVDAARYGGKSFDEISEAVRTQRNVVIEMVATLKAVKPVRKPGSMKPPPMQIEIQPIDIGSAPPV